MNARSIVATLVALCFSLFAATSFAQTSPSAPTITSVTGNLTSLTVVWSAPTEDGGSTITAYDLRYIRSDAAANATDSDWTVIDDAWTTGPLTYTLTHLRRDTSYDVALRAENTDAESAWSDTTTTGTTDHGDSTAAATTLALGATIEGSINPSLDADYFRIVVSSGTDLWVYASGPLDTTGYLLNSNGNMLNQEPRQRPYHVFRCLLDPSRSQQRYLLRQSRKSRTTAHRHIRHPCYGRHKSGLLGEHRPENRT